MRCQTRGSLEERILRSSEPPLSLFNVIPSLLLDERIEEHTADAYGASDQLDRRKRLAEGERDTDDHDRALGSVRHRLRGSAEIPPRSPRDTAEIPPRGER